jgi:tetratricopeptide (TPR) repeat protein
MKKIFSLLILLLAIQTYSQEYKRLYMLGVVKEERLKDYVNCIDLYSKSIELNINHIDDEILADTYYHRGMCKRNLKFYNEAIIDFTKAIEIDKNLDYYLERGICKFYNGIDGLEDVNRCILGARKDLKGKAFLLRGFYYQSKNQIAQACSDWNEALELGTDSKKLIDMYCK